MEIRPCDAQMFINKSTENNKNNNDTLKQNDLYQNLSENFKKNIENDNIKTIQSNKSQGELIDSDKKGNSHFNNNQNPKKSKKKNEENENTNKSKHLFDVSI